MMKIEQLKHIRDAMQILVNGIGLQDLPYALSTTEYAKVQRAQRLVNQLIDEEGKKE
ncbi:hypothetical protein [Oxalobacter formigenes]